MSLKFLQDGRAGWGNGDSFNNDDQTKWKTSCRNDYEIKILKIATASIQCFSATVTAFFESKGLWFHPFSVN